MGAGFLINDLILLPLLAAAVGVAVWLAALALVTASIWNLLPAPGRAREGTG